MNIFQGVGAVAVAFGLCMSAQAADWVNYTSTSTQGSALRQLPVEKNIDLGPHSTLIERQRIRLKNGKELVRSQQLYKGVPILDSNIVQQKSESRSLHSPIGRLASNIDDDLTSVTAKISAKKAFKRLLKKNKHRRSSKIENRTTELFDPYR
ncbi:hypothetical protein [Sinobacterium caligoides]|uniref:hypothetical protein n=1 Tax=Sinobacterium caligoides TaxID=933926 RepID=UPI0013C2EC40|nr:hypothetical protein [Sinobacterium caligoides]